MIQPHITKTKIMAFLTGIFVLLAMQAGGYALSILFSSTVCTANFPGQEIARSITKAWHNTYHSKLEYVAGSRWIAGNISFYSTDHPAVLIEWDKQRAPWINLQDMKKKGAVFIWEVKDKMSKDNMPSEYLGLKNIKIWEFDWHRNFAHLPPARIAIAFLPPINDTPRTFAKASEQASA